MKKVFLLLAFAAANTCFSQSVTNLNPLTVTATRTLQKTSETGRSITVIDGNLFNQLPVTSIDELLKYVPGVEIQQRGTGGAQSDIILRGSTFQQVLVLLDGLKINDPITGHFSSYIPITPGEIERIEILKGPAAAIYGAEAVGGVINVISKMYTKYKKEKSNTTNTAVSAGEFGYATAQAGIYHTGQKINFSLGTITNNADGQLLRGNNKAYYHNHTLSGTISTSFKNNWNVLLRSNYDSRDFAAQNYYTTFVSDTAVEKVNTWWNQLKIKHGGAKNADEIDVAYKQTTDYYLYNPLSVANNNKSKLFILQYLHTANFSKHLKINYGTQFSNRSITSNDRGNHHTTNGAVFTSIQYNYKKLIVNPAVRVDFDENYGTQIIPQANISYHIKKINLRANAGRAIRSADFTERYNNYGKTLVTGGSIGNPDLSAEKSWNYEAGISYQLKNSFTISGGVFARDQKDVIDYVRTAYADMPRKENLSATGIYALAKNIKTVVANGVEFDATYQLAFANHQFIYINTGASLIHSSSSDSIPSFYIISHAKKIWQLNAIYRIKNFQIAFNTIYKVRNEQSANAITTAISKSYFLANTKLQYHINKNWQTFIAINNLGNISYSDLLGSKMPGRWVSSGVSFTVN